MPAPTTPALVYVGDPMCSWCWGFAPVLERLSQESALPVHVVVGGLRPGPAAVPLDEVMKRYLRREWSRIHEVTGQPFSFDALDREEWIYDTFTPAVAVTGMRRFQQDRTVTFFTRLQEAFYAESVDVTDPAVYPTLLDGFDVDAEAFVSFLKSEEGGAAARADFARAAELGVTGFPTLLYRSVGGQLSLLTWGYAPHESVQSRLEAVLSQEVESS